MARVSWSPTATRHLTRVLNEIADGSPALGTKWARKFVTATDMLGRFPEIGSPVEDSARPGYREQLVGPYRVLYRFDGTTCEIVAVLHAKQDIDRWLPPEDAP